MSTCISINGEFSSHGPGDYCPLCGAFNEEEIIAERDVAQAKLERIRTLLKTWDMETYEPTQYALGLDIQDILDGH